MRYDYEIWTQYVFDGYVIACQRILLRISFWQFYGNKTNVILTEFSKQKIFDGPYLGQFSSDFQKLGTILFGEARSLKWVYALMIPNIIFQNRFFGSRVKKCIMYIIFYL